MNGLSDIHWQGIRLDGIVFDLDGTLTDSIEAYYQVFREATARVGIVVKRKDVLEPMATSSPIWERAIPLDIPDRDKKIEQIMGLILPIFQKTFERVQPFPGVESVLKALVDRGVRLGVVTASRSDALRPLKHHDLTRFFKTIITGDDGFPQKPEPGGILECMRRIGVSPGNAVTIGDTPMDIIAGKEAGSLTIGVLSGIASRSQLEAETPTLVIQDVPRLLSVFRLSEV